MLFNLLLCHLHRFSGWLEGGADEGAFPHFGSAPAESAAVVVVPAPADAAAASSSANSGAAAAAAAARPPAPGDVLLEVCGQKVAGYTMADVSAWIAHCLAAGQTATVRIVPKGRGVGEIRELQF